nr:hypothetical protein [Tanacetum cinerariifolium]
MSHQVFLVVIIVGDLTKLFSVNTKLLKDLKELEEYDQSTKNVVLKTNKEPPQDSDIPQLIEECFVEVPEQQKQKMEDTMFDLVKICHHKQFLCIHDDVDDLIESALDSKLLSINFINSQQSNAKNLLPILSECEVTLEDKRKCDELICENSSTIDVCDNHSEILFDSNNDDLSSDDESFEDIEYVDASVPDLVIVSVEEENVVQREVEEVDLEDISQVQDVVLQGDVCFLEELLIDDSILSHESFDSSFEDNPSISRPPSEPPDDNFDLEPEVISAVMEVIDEPDEHFNPGGEIFVSTKIEDDDYFPLMFVIRFFLPYLILLKISPLLLSAESEDTIFDPGIFD